MGYGRILYWIGPRAQLLNSKFFLRNVALNFGPNEEYNSDLTVPKPYGFLQPK